MTDLTVANTIREQIGRKACVMIGAKDFSGTSDSLQFRIGRNSKKVDRIVVTLNGDDTYSMVFYGRMSRKTYTMPERAKVEGIYFDAMRPMIEEHTGMFTSL